MALEFLRIVLGVLLIFVLPGVALIKAMFPSQAVAAATRSMAPISWADWIHPQALEQELS